MCFNRARSRVLLYGQEKNFPLALWPLIFQKALAAFRLGYYSTMPEDVCTYQTGCDLSYLDDAWCERCLWQQRGPSRIRLGMYLYRICDWQRIYKNNERADPPSELVFSEMCGSITTLDLPAPRRFHSPSEPLLAFVVVSPPTKVLGTFCPAVHLILLTLCSRRYL
jgi:hypothetical protein